MRPCSLSHFSLRGVLRLTAALGLGACVSVLTGCGDGSDSGRAGVTMTVDTVGDVVRITHSGAPPVVELEEVLTLGTGASLYGEASPEEFGRVSSLLGGPDGGVYVADALASEVRAFNRSGGFEGSLAGRGAGPGELEAAQSMAWMGDSLLVMDNQNARLTLLTRDGEYAGQWPYIRLSGTGVRLRATGRHEVYAPAFRMLRTPDGPQSQTVWARHTPEGPADSLVVPRLEQPLPGTGQVCRGTGAREGWISSHTNPHGDGLLTSPAPDLLVARAMKSAYEIAWTDAAGDTVRVLRVDHAPLPLPDSVWDEAAAEYDEWWTEWRSGNCEGSFSRPSHAPILESLDYDQEGRLMVEVRTADGRSLDVFDQDHRWVARIPLPERDGRVPPSLRGDRLHLAVQDSMEVQTVRVYRLRSPAGDD